MPSPITILASYDTLLMMTTDPITTKHWFRSEKYGSYDGKMILNGVKPTSMSGQSYWSYLYDSSGIFIPQGFTARTYVANYNFCKLGGVEENAYSPGLSFSFKNDGLTGTQLMPRTGREVYERFSSSSSTGLTKSGSAPSDPGDLPEPSEISSHYIYPLYVIQSSATTVSVRLRGWDIWTSTPEIPIVPLRIECQSAADQTAHAFHYTESDFLTLVNKGVTVHGLTAGTEYTVSVYPKVPYDHGHKDFLIASCTVTTPANTDRPDAFEWFVPHKTGDPNESILAAEWCALVGKLAHLSRHWRDTTCIDISESTYGGGLEYPTGGTVLTSRQFNLACMILNRLATAQSDRGGNPYIYGTLPTQKSEDVWVEEGDAVQWSDIDSLRLVFNGIIQDSVQPSQPS